MRVWIGRQVARYEHAARRVQLFIFAIIAVNTSLEAAVAVGIEIELPLIGLIFSYALAGIGLIFLGYISHKSRVGAEIARAQYDIEGKEVDVDRVNALACKYAIYDKMSLDELKEEWKRIAVRLNYPKEEWIDEI